MVRFYPAIIERGESGSFSVFFPDVPGCGSGGATLQEATRNAEVGLQAHISLGAEYGGYLPPPSELDEIVVDDDVNEAARLLVRVTMPSEPVHIDLFVPSDLLESIDDVARYEGPTRASVVIDAARERVRMSMRLSTAT